MKYTRYMFDPEHLARRADQLLRMAKDLEHAGREAARIIDSVPSEAGVSSGGVESPLSSAAGALRSASTDLRNRAVYLTLAEKTGNPLFVGMATMPVPPHFNVKDLGIGAGQLGAGALIEKLAKIHGAQADILALQADDVLKQLMSHSGRDAAFTEHMWKLAKEDEVLRELATHNSQLAARFKLAGHALSAAGSLYSFYTSYRDSAATNPAYKALSGGLSVAFTYNPALAAFDLVSGGAGSGAADYYAVTAEELQHAITHGDSSYLFGQGTSKWNDDNLSGNNGWLLQSYAQMGDAASEPIGGVLDKVHPGFPFDGDGSINWKPDGDTVKGWFS